MTEAYWAQNEADMSIKSAFQFAYNLQAREMQLEKRDASSIIDIKVCPSNYMRNFSLPEEVISEGREFIVSFELLGSFGEVKRGDRLIDSELGTMPISWIKPMYDLGGQTIAYRVRTN